VPNDDCIKSAELRIERIRVTKREIDDNTGGRRLGAGALEHPFGKVDARDLEMVLRKQHGEGTGAAPNIEDAGRRRREEIAEPSSPRSSRGRVSEPVIRFIVEAVCRCIPQFGVGGHR
jgi:hypothetical protein